MGGYLALNLYVSLPVRCMSVVFSEKSISLMSAKRIAETNGLGEALKYFCPVTIFINPSQCCTNVACHLKVDGEICTSCGQALNTFALCPAECYTRALEASTTGLAILGYETEMSSPFLF